MPSSYRLAIAQVVVPAANERVIEALVEHLRQVIIETPAPFAEGLAIVEAAVVGDTLRFGGVRRELCG